MENKKEEVKVNSFLEATANKIVEEGQKKSGVELTKEEKEAKFKEAYDSLKNYIKLKNKQARGNRNVPGAFGGAHPGTKRKKKFARYVARNTVE